MNSSATNEDAENDSRQDRQSAACVARLFRDSPNAETSPVGEEHEFVESTDRLTSLSQHQHQLELRCCHPPEPPDATFDRLHPNRRSFSTPQLAMNLRHKNQNQSSCKLCQPDNDAGSGQVTTIRHNHPAAKTNRSANSQRLKPSNKLTASGCNGKLRRRTALGLIPSQWASQPKLSPQSQPADRCTSTSNLKETSGATSSWRSWFNCRPNSGKRNSVLRNLSGLSSSPKLTGLVDIEANLRVASDCQQTTTTTTCCSCTHLSDGKEPQQDLELQLEPQPERKLTISSEIQHQTQRATDESQQPTQMSHRIDGHQEKNTRTESRNNDQRSSQRKVTCEPQSVNNYNQNDTTQNPSDTSNKSAANQNANSLIMEVANEKVNSRSSLVEQLIDSQLEWRHLIRDANGGLESLKSLSEMQIKRQEVIHELVQTERSHCLTLALMRQVYLSGLKRLNELRCANQDHGQHLSRTASESGPALSGEPIDLERLFPALEDLVQAHELFFAHLRLKLVESCQRDPNGKQLLGVVGPLGDLLRDQFRLKKPQEELQLQYHHNHHLQQVDRPKIDVSCGREYEKITPQFETNNEKNNCQKSKANECNGNGQKLLQTYAKFCGSHYDSSRYYKQLMQTDKGFKQFIEQCNKQHEICRQRGIPECNLLVTQRLTKYPLLIEQLIKTSKGEPNDEEAKLRLALAECKALLAELNQQLARKESFERLLDIYAQFSPKSYTIYNRHLRFTKHDLLQHKRIRQLLHTDDQVRIWSATRRKLFQVLCLILNDIVVFLRIETPGASGGTLSSSPLVSLETPIGSDQLTTGAESSSCHQEHQQHSLLAGSQCALINVVAATANQLIHQQNHHNNNHHHHQPVNSQVQQLTSGQSGINIRYYFANIDNKSSVISLGKLLIRDKAANEAEPRTYLISSSPRQPEMYELAFVSRRHQTTFVEKLKSSIDSYNKKLAECTDLSDIDQDEVDDFHDLVDMYDERLHDNTSDDDHEDQSHETNDSMQSETKRSSFVSAPETQDQIQPRGCSRVPKSEINGDLEFDIEQDVVEPPVGATDMHLSPDSSPSLVYETPKGKCLFGAVEGKSFSEEDDECRLASNESGLSERAKDSMDESCHTNKQRLRSTRRRRIHRPRNVSNQSSSSSEAAHRQAIEMIASEKVAAKTNQVNHQDEDFDSGRGHDDSSSTSSNSAPEVTNKPSDSRDEAESQKRASKESGELETQLLTKTQVSSGCSSGSDSVVSTLATGSPQSANSPTSKSAKELCSARNCKSATSISKQQRKLSTVSTMSSQLKLLSRLRGVAGGVGGGGSQSGSLRCCCAAAVSHAHLASDQTDATLSRQMRQQMRSRAYIPEQKLEELRDLQLQLERDKHDWQVKFERMQEQLLTERRDLDLAREKLRQDRQQVANEREQLYRKLDVLKEKGILLSPSHNVIITAPEVRTRLQVCANQVACQQQLRPSYSSSNMNAATSIQIVQQPNGSLGRHSTHQQNAKVPLYLSEKLNSHHHPTPSTCTGNTSTSTSTTGNNNINNQMVTTNSTSAMAVRLPFFTSLLGVGAGQKTPKIIANPNESHLI